MRTQIDVRILLISSVAPKLFRCSRRGSAVLKGAPMAMADSAVDMALQGGLGQFRLKLLQPLVDRRDQGGCF